MICMAEGQEVGTAIPLDINETKAEAYKEFAEKIKDIAFPLLPHDTARDGFVLHLKQLLKEMVGRK